MAIINASPRDIAAIDLDRALNRLERKILSADADPRLQHSSYQRIKTSANLEFARTLLLRLEHDSSTLKIQSRKAAAQSSLSAQRALIKRLTDRLHELEQIGDDDDLLYGPEDEEDILASYEDEKSPTPPKTIPSEKSEYTDRPPLSGRPPSPQSILRNRFQPSKPPDAVQADTSTAAILQENDSEATNLTSSLLSLAKALKASSTQFSDSLAADDEALRRATEGLDKNERGLEAAGKRMGLLKRMSEGKGWWGRIMLYAWIGGLWVVAVLLVFVGPKLRF
ncbi:MAG: hypothetical protein Q9164_006676 [Protoblastenia rupestris]